MIKIIATTPATADGTSYYRAFGVFKHLQSICDVQFTSLPPSYQWPFLRMNDIFFLHRPFEADKIPLLQYAKELGLKVWVDHDDNLFTLPPENPSFERYNEQAKNDIFKILKLADVITVSTEELKIFFDKMGFFNVTVIPNAVDDTFPNAKPIGEFNKTKNFFWRGTPTHHGDLYDFQQEIFEAIGKTDAPWYFFGYNPYFITRICDPAKVRYLKAEDIIQYFKLLKFHKPHLMHVPLSDNYFNKCKSNIAWIEATAAGAACVAPDWPEWQRPGILNYKNPEEYYNILTSLPDLEKSWKESHDFIMENLTLTKVNYQRKEIIENLM